MADTIKCLLAINNVREDVQGHDPRTWIKSCALDTILNGGDSKHFKKCLQNKITKEVKDVKDPEKYVNSLWDEIKGSCR